MARKPGKKIAGSNNSQGLETSNLTVGLGKGSFREEKVQALIRS